MNSLIENTEGLISCPSRQTYSFGYNAVFSAFVALIMGIIFAVLYLISEVLHHKFSGMEMIVRETFHD